MANKREILINDHYFHFLPKYFHIFRSLVKNLIQKTGASSVHLNIIKPDDTVFDIPLHQHNYFDWHYSQPISADPLYGYHNLLQLPHLFYYNSLQKLAPDLPSNLALTLDPFLPIIVAKILNTDNSINLITLGFQYLHDIKISIGEIYPVLQQFNNALANMMMDKQYAIDQCNITGVANPIQLNTIANPAYTLISQLNLSEKKTLLAIYHGYITNKDISTQIYRSSRTAEIIVKKLISLFNCNTRYALWLNIRNMHELVYAIVKDLLTQQK
ncbi:hypothetical protein [Cysteiniphilum sp. 6C5]|uniref:hypothetical protein n=1 Tax=unclassified Cysteiniphilum TaxID=2610889 RepID=UPI003F83E711